MGHLNRLPTWQLKITYCMLGEAIVLIALSVRAKLPQNEMLDSLMVESLP